MVPAPAAGPGPAETPAAAASAAKAMSNRRFLAEAVATVVLLAVLLVVFG